MIMCSILYLIPVYVQCLLALLIEHTKCCSSLTCGGSAGENGGGGGRPGWLEGREIVELRDSETSTKVERFWGC